ncbi:uncharacterized protein ATNIH1004_008552 [Aspergillus tanneri]|uniref:Uncharacterized protein n=1 Tax=Aspergillus tanneri TaxID=1220188 RepID=A0A5M9MBW0_9EURO|nr:uncharacterized protein ATNIH1004_008552 [Aspergillus tanneri]KAA8644351.1 hypothetical protein ATNIH1004_008552 [Aspergillus tanneri]
MAFAFCLAKCFDVNKGPGSGVRCRPKSVSKARGSSFKKGQMRERVLEGSVKNGGRKIAGPLCASNGDDRQRAQMQTERQCLRRGPWGLRQHKLVLRFVLASQAKVPRLCSWPQARVRIIYYSVTESALCLWDQASEISLKPSFQLAQKSGRL